MVEKENGSKRVQYCNRSLVSESAAAAAALTTEYRGATPEAPAMRAGAGKQKSIVSFKAKWR